MSEEIKINWDKFNEDTWNEMEARIQKLEEALRKIKDGGIPHGVPANTAQRMFAMCDIATEALGGGCE